MKPDDEDGFTKALRRYRRRQSLVGRAIAKVANGIPYRVRRMVAPDPDVTIAQRLDNFAATSMDVHLVQIGSCDGVSNDPICKHVIARGWRGVVVEPVPSNFKRLERTYKEVSKVQCMQVAIGRQSGTLPFYYCTQGSDDDPIWYQQIGSFDRKHLEKHAQFDPQVSKYIAEMEVTCLNLTELIARANLARVDLLHTDCEGFDYEILQQIPFDRIQPKIILFEEFHLKTKDRLAATSLLKKQGYELLRGTMDALAWLP